MKNIWKQKNDWKTKWKKMKLQMKTQMKNKWKKIILNISNLWLDANHISRAGNVASSSFGKVSDNALLCGFSAHWHGVLPVWEPCFRLPCLLFGVFFAAVLATSFKLNFFTTGFHSWSPEVFSRELDLVDFVAKQWWPMTIEHNLSSLLLDGDWKSRLVDYNHWRLIVAIIHLYAS